MKSYKKRCEAVKQWIVNPFPDLPLTDDQRIALRLACHGRPIPEIAETLDLTRDAVYKMFARQILVALDEHENMKMGVVDLPRLILTMINEEVDPEGAMNV